MKYFIVFFVFWSKKKKKKRKEFELPVFNCTRMINRSEYTRANVIGNAF